MPLRKLVSPSLTDLFVEEIKRLIFTGELKTGERLPSERQLANESEVSLAVVNAGISRLSSMGLLKVIPRQGVFVTDYVREGNIQTIKEILDFSGRRLNNEIMIPILECRRGIEIAAKKTAAENRTDEDLRRIFDILDQISDKKNYSRYAELAFCFHHECAIASQNIYYPMLIRTFEPLYMLFASQYMTPEIQEIELGIFKEIYNSIRDRDPASAAKAASEDIDLWKDKMILESTKKRI